MQKTLQPPETVSRPTPTKWPPSRDFGQPAPAFAIVEAFSCKPQARFLPRLLAGSVQWEEKGFEGRRDGSGMAGRGTIVCMLCRRSLGEVSVDRSRVGPGLRSPSLDRCRHACAPTQPHLHPYTRVCSCILHSSVSELPLALHLSLSLSSALSLDARKCACVPERHAPGFAVVFARRGASPSVAASRPAKILARSVCSLASLVPSLLSLFLLFGAPLFSPVEPPRHQVRVPFSPFQSLRRKVPSPAGESALRLRRRYRERKGSSMKRREENLSLTRIARWLDVC